MKHFFHVMFGAADKVHKFETDPVEQYHFHLFFTWFWFLAMGFIYFVVPHHSRDEKVALVILVVSLWANFVSHFTAVGAAIAGIYASHHEEILDGHMVRGFLGRVSRKNIKLSIFSNPNYKPPMLQDEGSEGTTAWIDELRDTPSSLPDYQDISEKLVALPSEPLAPGDIVEPKLEI